MIQIKRGMSRSGDALNTAADYLAIFVIFLVPIVGVVVFWLVHILPEIMRPAIRKVLQSFTAAAALAVAGVALPPSAHASFLPPEMMDSAAMGIAWFVIIIVPIGGIVLFWLVHILPEKIAHKRHHPQRDAIQTLCLLSLVFGGLLWPIAWLWAYSKPVLYRHAYGTDKHEDHYHELGEKAQAGELLEHELRHLREELDAMAAKGALSAELKVLREDLAAAIPAPAVSVAAQAAPAGSDAKAGGA